MQASSEEYPQLSLITTCKNRLHHLRQTLPGMLAQTGAEVIVVDYGCPQGTAAWVRETHPQAKVIKVAGDPVFCVAHARNLGAAKARGKTLCFIDADILLRADLGAWVQENVRESAYYLCEPPCSWSVSGTVICGREDFKKIGGYDIAFQSWGGEDGDLYERLSQAGLARLSFPSACVAVIEHGDEARQFERTAGGNDKELTLATNRLYRQVKRDFGKLCGAYPDLKARRSLMAAVRREMRKMADGQATSLHLEIAVNPGLDSRVGLPGLARRLVYDLERPENQSAEEVFSRRSVNTNVPGIAIFVEEAAFDLGRHAFMRLIMEALQQRGHRVFPVKIGDRLPNGVDMGILHVDTTWLSPERLALLPSDIPVMNRAVADISKRRISRMLLTRDAAYAGQVIVKSDANYGGKRKRPDSLASELLQHAGGIDGYRIFETMAAVPDAVWSDRDLVVEKFIPEIRGGKYCLRKWVFSGEQSLHLMDISDDPVVKAGTSGNERLEEAIPEELRVRRRELGFDYGKFDYVLHAGQPVLLDANSTPGFSRDSAKLRGYAAQLAAGMVSWYRATV